MTRDEKEYLDDTKKRILLDGLKKELCFLEQNIRVKANNTRGLDSYKGIDLFIEFCEKQKELARILESEIKTIEAFSSLGDTNFKADKIPF